MSVMKQQFFMKLHALNVNPAFCLPTDRPMAALDNNYTVSISPPDFMHIFQLWNGWTNHDEILPGESMDP